MVSVRRVAPILLLAVTIPAWAEPQAATKTDTQATATTATQPAAKKTAKAPLKKTTLSPSPVPAPQTTTAAPAPVPASASAPAKKPAKKAAKKSAAETATKPSEKPAAKSASAKTPKSTSHPPRELHRVGDHWTPYNPPDPSTYPAGSKTYAIKQGDTLWGLAKQFYNNGYMWPQLWEANTWITDAHWIYPGDVLLLQGEISQQAQGTGTTGGTAAAGSTTQTTTTTGTSTVPGARALGAPGAVALVTAADAIGGSAGPIPLATEADIYCYGYIGDPNEPMPSRIAGYEDVEVRYIPGAAHQDLNGAEGDLVFIDGVAGLTAGDTYELIVPEGKVEHPRTHELLGRQYRYRGQVRVLCLEGGRARGIITQSCSEVPVGARLKPIPVLPIPLARVPNLPAFCDPASGKTNGTIVSAEGGDWLTNLGVGQLIQIDLGRDQQVQPGEFLTVFRDGPGALPRQILGEIAVLTSENRTATAKIVLMRYSMRIGDRVEIR